MNRVWMAWLIGWLGGSVIAIANGALRELAYKPRIGELPAHYVSTALLIGLLTGYMRALDARWPLPSGRSALAVGTGWLGLTMVFEFGFGHYVDGYSWERLLEQYDVTRGNVWVLVLLWTAIGPAAVRTLRARQDGAVRAG